MQDLIPLHHLLIFKERNSSQSNPTLTILPSSNNKTSG